MADVYADSIQAKVNGTSQPVPIRDITKAPAIIESAFGESIQLSDSGEAPMHRVNLYGKCEQVKTTGANLFTGAVTDEIEITRSMSYSCELKPGEYTVSCSVDSNDTDSDVSSIYFFNSDFVSIIVSRFERGKYQSKIVTVPEGKVVKNVGLYSSKDYNTSAGDTVTFKNVMINTGSEALPYEPYTGGKPSPSPEYPQEIKTSGEDGNIEIISNNKNLIDYTQIEKVSSYATPTLIENGFSLSGTYYASIENIRLKKNTTYFLSSIADGATKGISVVPHGNTSSPIKSGGNNLSFNTGGNESVDILFYASGSSTPSITTYTNIQLEEASSATEYIPHEGSSAVFPILNGLSGIPVSSGGNYTDESGQQWVCDEIQADLVAGTGKYIQRVEKVTFDGSKDEEWYINSGAKYKYAYVPARNIGSYIVYCNKLRMVDISPENTVTGIEASTSSKLIYIRPDLDAVSSVNSIKEWLQKNPITVVYIETPIITNLTTEQITALKQLRTHQGITNIMTDTEPQVGVELEYIADTKTWINNKLAEIRAQILNMKA